MNPSSVRRVSLAAALICAALLSYGYYLQYVKGLEPCPLCLVQRLFFYAVMIVFLIAAVHAPGRIGARIYGAFVLLFAAGGAGTAGRQVWLQDLAGVPGAHGGP